MASEEVVYRIDLAGGDVVRLEEITLQSVGMRERADLQRWVIEHPEIVGDDLLLITSEFDRWELRERRVPDRLDVLFLDSNGSLVIAELKRDRATDTVDLQALKYAAYCSQLTVDDAVEEFARYHDVSADEARLKILEHAPALEEEAELGAIRIRLVAGSFGPSVTSVVLWLREHDIDIGCVEVTARSAGDGVAVLSARQLLPLPEAEEYLVRRRRRERIEEITRVSGTRGLNSIRVLAEAGVLNPEDILTLGLDTLRERWREPVATLLASDPTMGRARWTGEQSARSLRWEYDGEVYSATGLAKKVIALAGLGAPAVPGPDHWVLPDGRAMYPAALEVRASDAATGGS
jgi:hypothetical protein